MRCLKLRKTGNALCVTIPKAVLERYGLKEGDPVKLGLWAERFTLAPLTDDEKRLQKQLEVAEHVMGRHAGALKRLAG